MKNYRNTFFIIAAAAIVFSACEDLLGDLLKFNSGWYTTEFTIEPSDETGDIIFKTEELSADVDSILEANGVTQENLNSIRISDAKVSILTEDCTFDPVTRIEFFLETSSLGSTRVAWLDTIPQDATSIELELSLDDLQEYLMEETFTLTASGNLGTRVDKDVDLVAEIRFLIRGGLAQ